MSSSYNVVFTGQLKPGVNAEQAARDFGAVFKVPDDKAWRLVLSGKRRTLKHDVPADNAERYRELLEEIGLVVRVEPAGARAASRPGEPPAAGGPPPPPGAGEPHAPDAYHDSDLVQTVVASPVGPPDVDPYAPPAADLTGAGGELHDTQTPSMTGPHAVPAGHGWRWIAEGWELFKGAPLSWIGAFLTLSLMNLLASLIPAVGGVVGTLLGPVFLGGIMLGAHAQASGGSLKVADVFSGFSANPGKLLLIGALYLVAIFGVVFVTVVLMTVFGMSLGGLDPAALEQQDPALVMATLGPMLLLAVLFMMLLIIPVVMAYWFAPVLVVLEDIEPLQAMKLSFTACWRNVMPFLVYGLAALALVIVGMIPLLLGLFIVSPLLIASMYTAYRDIFYRQ